MLVKIIAKLKTMILCIAFPSIYQLNKPIMTDPKRLKIVIPEHAIKSLLIINLNLQQLTYLNI